VIGPDDDGTVVVPAKQGGRRDTATPLFLEVLRAALDTKGEYFTPDGKLPLQAGDQQYVRELFYRRYVNAEEDKKKSHGAQTMPTGERWRAPSPRAWSTGRRTIRGSRCSGSLGMRGRRCEAFVTIRPRFRPFKNDP
jgi:hypothetical protein